ncbi:MAG: ATP-binding protein [Bacteroidaceae bacterium]|nr:ATP-binding protein [Bacteroidaceae bacterium]
MDSFFRTHSYLVTHNGNPIRRDLMDEINWNDRLIGIKGARGVGKTTFLLQYAKERFSPDDRTCLYINTNNFYVQNVGITEFATEFYNNGGKVLLIDQVYKQPGWSTQLRECYDKLPGLKIVFTGSPVMRLKEENPELNGIVKSYNLRGFSFREYLQVMTGINLPKYTLEDIISNHTQIANDIMTKVNPKDHLQNYLHHGYYPFFLSQGCYSEKLLNTMNMMIEVDILLVKQIELKYLAKIKQLFYLLTTSGSIVPNVSQLSVELEMSRATVMRYIKYLMEARLVNMVYAKGDQYPKKPARVLLHNTNLMYSFYPRTFDSQDVQETFFCNSLWKDHEVYKHGQQACSFNIDGQYEFKIVEHSTKLKSKSKTLFAVNHCEVGQGNQIPLWLFGFLY